MEGNPVNLDTALCILAECGSDNDPITYKGEYCDPRSLEETLTSHTPASEIRIKYFGGLKTREINGTLSGMVRDRKRLTGWEKPAPRDEDDERCEHCGR